MKLLAEFDWKSLSQHPVDPASVDNHLQNPLSTHLEDAELIGEETCKHIWHREALRSIKLGTNFEKPEDVPKPSVICVGNKRKIDYGVAEYEKTTGYVYIAMYL